MSAGMDWDPWRVDSSLINTPDYYAQQAAAQQQALAAQQAAQQQAAQQAAAQQQAAFDAQKAAIPTPQNPLDYLSQLTWQRATEMLNAGQASGDVSAIYADLRNQSDRVLAQNGTSNRNPGFYLWPILGNQAYEYQNYAGQAQNGMPAGYGNPGAYGYASADYNQQVGAIDTQAQAARAQAEAAQKAQADAAAKAQAEAAAKAKAEADARANNQATQQQAYNQQTGGGFNGGILNSSYAQPFGNTITGTADTTGTAGFMGGMMGAPTTAAPSTGLTPTGPATGMLGTGFGSVAAPQAGASAWGGPFSNKNPWSLG